MAALDWPQCPAVESIPDKVSGAWVFKGTRPTVAFATNGIWESNNVTLNSRSVTYG